MENARWRPVARLACLAALVAALSGCFEYKEVMTVTSDGSGTVEINATLPEDVAAKFRKGTFTDQVPAPVRAGVIQQLMTGSARVRMTFCDVTLENNVWTYSIKVEFDNVRDLSAVRYFKGRNLTFAFSAAKELHYREEIYPSLLQMAKDEAKVISDDAYAEGFLAVVDSPDFAKTYLENARLTYEVVMPGINVTSDGKSEILPDDRVRVTKEYKITDFLKTDVRQSMDIRTGLPAEKGFMPVVVILLLASVVGILVPAIRLLMLKSKGAS